MIFSVKDTENENMEWAIVYDKARRDDGSLFFPQRLTDAFLKAQRMQQGPYIYANQYQNEIIPDGDQDFKKEWLKYYVELPSNRNRFAFIDPAISMEDNACYTAFVLVSVDDELTWYLEQAKRVRITATQTVKLVFDLFKIYKPMVIGIESVAYQEALMHFLDDKMRTDQVFVPVKGVKRSSDKSKLMRIRSLVPRFEWGRILIKPGLIEFEDEYSKFPRGQYVDILDALSSIEEIAFAPGKKKEFEVEPAPNDPNYERWYISQLAKGKRPGQTSEDR